MTVDLRRASLGEIRAIDFRASERDFFADGRAVFDQFCATWAGLDDPAWRLAGASSSDAGGADWSFGDHVAHLAGWAEVGVGIATRALDTGSWPSDDEFGGGNFDQFNEALRARWATVPPAEVRTRLLAATALADRARPAHAGRESSAATTPGAGCT